MVSTNTYNKKKHCKQKSQNLFFFGDVCTSYSYNARSVEERNYINVKAQSCSIQPNVFCCGSCEAKYCCNSTKNQLDQSSCFANNSILSYLWLIMYYLIIT